ncbi:MAG: WYL domain-containing transcriptional regulator [Deltaproteobacteria bacterium]|nr:WYL domain-containing transcriptional regulator [Deltaproteobacteria bacterium]
MGSRSPSATPLAILAALLEQRTVRQAELATRLQVKSETIRKHMLELQAQGVPLEREEDGGQVYWSVPADWGPHGLLLASRDVAEIVKLLSRLPRGAARDRLIAALTRRLASDLVAREALDQRLDVILARRVESDELRMNELVEDAAARRTSLHMKYFSMVRGELAWRHVSVLRVMPHLRFVARCHRDDRLKWFRIANVADARLDPQEPFRATPAADVEAHIARSTGGFVAQEPVVDHVFEVREPECNWVEKNLPPASATVERVAGGMRVSVRSAALAMLARFVLGLGGAARATTPALREAVRGLALRALDAHREDPEA